MYKRHHDAGAIFFIPIWPQYSELEQERTEQDVGFVHVPESTALVGSF